MASVYLEFLTNLIYFLCFILEMTIARYNRTNIINDHGVCVDVTFSIFQLYCDYQTYCGTENNMTVVTNLQMKSTTTCKFHNILTLSVVYIGERTHLSGVKPVFRGQRHESIDHPSSPYTFIFATPMCPLKCL